MDSDDQPEDAPQPSDPAPDDNSPISAPPAPAPTDDPSDPPADVSNDAVSVVMPSDQASSTAPIASPVVSPSASITPAPADLGGSLPPAFDPHSSGELNFLRMVLGPKAWAAHRARTQERLDKVMALAQAKGTIDRTAVRLHLDVSQAAATRYLTALVKQGKLSRRHTQGDNVYTVVG